MTNLDTVYPGGNGIVNPAKKQISLFFRHPDGSGQFVAVPNSAAILFQALLGQARGEGL